MPFWNRTRRTDLSVSDYRPALADYVPLSAIPVDRQRSTSFPGAPTQHRSFPSYGLSDDPGMQRPFGQASAPLTPEERFSTFGATGTQFFAGLISEGVNGESEPPEWTGDRRWKTINTMYRRDGQFGATLNVCLLPLLQATYSINPGDDSDLAVQQAQFVADNLLHGMRQTWHHLLRTFYKTRMMYGHFMGEKCWTPGDDGKVRLSKIPVRLPETIYRWFPNNRDELDRIMQRVWMQNADGITGTYKFPIIPMQKLVLSTRNQEGNDFRGVSLFRQAWFHGDIKFKLYIIDAIAAERNGLGIPWAQPPNEPGVTVQKSDWDQAAAVLASFHAGEKQYMLFPRGWQWGVKAVEGQVRNIMPSIEHHDLLIPRSVLAQFINVDSGGTLIAARDASSFFLQAEQAESDEGNEDINRVIRELIDLNTVEHGGPWPKPERYPTLAVTGIENRDLDALLKGISGLFTAGALTPNAETENAIRGYLDLPDLPAAASPAGGGQATVDTDSQGDTTAEDQAAGVEGVGAAGDTTGLARTALSRSGLPVGSRVTFHSGAPLHDRAVHLSGQQLRKPKTVVYMAGTPNWPEREDLGLRDIFDKIKSLLPGQAPKSSGSTGYIPGVGVDIGTKPAGTIRYRWKLGDGGVSGKHCPACIENAKNGPYTADTLPSHPGDGETFCGDSCTCTLVPVR